VRVVTLHLTNYRSWKECGLAFHPQLSIVIGENGSGKTNILDALYLASYGRTLRGRDEDAIRWGERESSVRATFRSEGGAERAVQVTLGPEGKSMFLGGRRLEGRTELVGLFPLVLSSSDDLDIVQGDPERRRNFLDAVASLLYRGYLDTLREYKRALRQRNRILLEMALGRGGSMVSALAAWTERLVVLGEALLRKRLRSLEELGPQLSEYYRELVGGGRCAVRYLSRVDVDVDDLRAALEKALAVSAVEERERGMTLVGPHRDDLALEVDGTDLRKFGSRGQARAAALALRLAEAKLVASRGEPPILAVDDAFSDLDDRRAERLLAQTTGFQTILTSAEEARTRELLAARAAHGRVFRIRENQVVEEVLA